MDDAFSDEEKLYRAVAPWHRKVDGTAVAVLARLAETGGNMITVTLDIASVFLGMVLGCFLTLGVCWLAGMF